MQTICKLYANLLLKLHYSGNKQQRLFERLLPNIVVWIETAGKTCQPAFEMLVKNRDQHSFHLSSRQGFTSEKMFRL